MVVRSISDLKPSVLGLVYKVQAHKKWTDAQVLEWLNGEVYLWTTSLMNAGNWIKGAQPNSSWVDANHQILTRSEAGTLRHWHSRPWEVMKYAEWERWTRELWHIDGTEVVSHWPFNLAFQQIEVVFPVEW